MLRKRLRVLGLVALVLAPLLAHAVPANAHYLAAQGTVRTWNQYCANARVEVSHGSYGGGYWKTDASSVQPDYFGSNCTTPFVRPAGYIAAHIYAMKWTGREWAVCFRHPWQYTKKSTAKMVSIAMAGSSRPPCGAGWYHNLGHAAVWDGQWYSGGFYSPKPHLLPA